MDSSNDLYKNMISYLRTTDLQMLLETFDCNKVGRKSELQNRALELLNGRTLGIDHDLYRKKISELYNILPSVLNCYNNNVKRNIVRPQQLPMNTQSTSKHAQQQRVDLFQNPLCFQQSFQRTQVGFLQMQQVIGVMCKNNYSCQNVDHHNDNIGVINLFDIKQPTLSYAPTLMNTDSFQKQNINFTKSPFYDVLFEILKPEVLVGRAQCSLPNAPKGTIEVCFKLNMTLDHFHAISMTLDNSKVPFVYIHQLQIRICTIEHGTTETKDFLPLGLSIRICNNMCILPPKANKPGIECRPIPKPINCTDYIKINPNIINTLTVNWIPDDKIYAIGVWIVKSLDLDYLLQKLKVKGVRRTEETKNCIIQKFVNVDPDLATTYYRVPLICPLGKIRMKLPVKSINCDHLQCFDASTFILMNENKPTWLCPICNKSCLYDDILIESYFLDIVSNPDLPDSCIDIEILPDGSWRVYEPNDELIDIKTDPMEFLCLDAYNIKDESAFTKKPSKVIETQLTPEKSLKKTEIMKCTFIDLTEDDHDEELPKEKDKHGNEALAINAEQPMIAENLILQAQVQPNQAVTSQYILRITF